jgi:hypothetical protein
MSLLLLLRNQGPPYHRFLLEQAQRLSDQGDHALAIVMAQMACEIATELVISAAYRRRGVADLEEPVSGLFPSFSLGNERLLKLYVALTGDKIQNESFWPAFKAHAKRRGGLIHGGLRVRQVGKAEAADSISAATELVDHLQTQLQALSSP